MSNTSLTVALVLTAVNNMPSVLKTAGNNVCSFANQVAQAGDDISKYDKKIEDLTQRMEKYGKLKSSGREDIQSGLVMAAPVEEVLRYAANFEGAMKKVENAIYDSSVPLSVQQKQMEALSAQATHLGNITTFNNIEAAEAQLQLIRNGMTYKDVLEGGATAALFLAQTAEEAPATTADAISQISNMFQLQGNQLLKVADDINRAANASSAGVTNLMHDLQQTGMAAHVLGLQVKDTTLMLGVLHNMGLGESSGTYLNDMLVNLNNITPRARTALQAMGWLEGATVKTLTSGKIRVTGGTNSLFDENGQIRSAQALVLKLRQVLYSNTGLKPSDMRDKAGNLLPQEQIEKLLGAKNKQQALQQLKDVFGVQGMRSAIALATPGKGSYEEMVKQAERAQRIQDQVMSWQETLLGKLETLKGTYETIMTQSGGPLTKEAGNIVKSTTDIVGAVGKWANANPKIVSGIIKIVGLLAVMKMGVGTVKWLSGGLMELLTWVYKLGTGGKWLITGVIRGGVSFASAFKYARSGAGIMRSLWFALSFGSPTLTRVGAVVSKLGGGFVRLGLQAITMGGKMALGWMIGLGPVGWIILGATALITAGVVAWKTNFLGFRDFATGVFIKVGQIVVKVMDGLLKKVENTIAVINKILTSLGMKPIKIDLIMKAREEINNLKDASTPGSKPKPKVVSAGAQNDNRQYNFDIKSTDPKGAAKEVSSVLGIDKYTRSRDPRLQNVFSY